MSTRKRVHHLAALDAHGDEPSMVLDDTIKPMSNLNSPLHDDAVIHDSKDQPIIYEDKTCRRSRAILFIDIHGHKNFKLEHIKTNYRTVTTMCQFDKCTWCVQHLFIKVQNVSQFDNFLVFRSKGKKRVQGNKILLD